MKGSILISGIYQDDDELGNVMNNLADHLSSNFNLTCIAFTPSGNQHYRELRYADPALHHVELSKNNLVLPKHSALYNSLRNNEYRSIITLGSVKLNAPFINQLRELNSHLPIISFLPYEGKVVNTLDASILNKIDFGVFYSKFTYDCFYDLVMFENIIEDFENKFGYIAHGVNTEKFYPISMDRAEKTRMARSKIPEYQSLPQDAFIVLNTNKPDYIKGLDSTLAAFKEFSSQRAHCYLHLHFGTMSNSWYQHVQSRIETYGLGNSMITTHADYPDTLYTDTWLNHVYNACDVGLSTSYGESWGQGVFEHAATMAPIIVPNHTVFREHWNHIALLTDICDTKYLACENTEIYIPSKKSIVESLKKLYDSKDLHHRYAENCFTHVTSGKYSWQQTADFFLNLLAKKEISQGELIEV
jgi:D-inositol-3-phosphate glycosyltransferase